MNGKKMEVLVLLKTKFKVFIVLSLQIFIISGKFRLKLVTYFYKLKKKVQSGFSFWSTY